jgi:hypothetical protein
MELALVYVPVETLLVLAASATFVVACFVRRKQTRNFCLCLGLVGITAWIPVYYWHWGPAHSPQPAAREFLQAAKNPDCQTLFGYFSAHAKNTIDAQSQLWHVSAEERYCKPGNIFHRYEPSSVRIRQLDATMAVVAIKKREEGDYLIPGLWPTEFKYADRQLTLVKEVGEWKIESIPAGPCGLQTKQDQGSGQSNCY